MIRRSFITLIIGFLFLSEYGCKQPYILPDSSSNNNSLVVEGVINTGSGPTTIKLSRTIKLTDTVNTVPELNAKVTIESDASPGGTPVLTLVNSTPGRYTTTATGLSAANNYRLRIVTSAGKTYLSDFVPVKNSPPIDSLGFEVAADGVHIYSDAHDPTNNTRYYRWDYTETWIIHSAYQSYFEVVTYPKDTIINRPPQDEIYTCWQSDTSSTIILNSSAKLSQDVIAHNPVAFAASTSEKIGLEYSITVTQYALTSDAFNFWQNLKLNTEQLGSIFDAQPSQLQGNIHCISNPSEPVRGYVSAGATSQKILFIGASSLPQYWYRTISLPYTHVCLEDSVYYVNPKTGANDVLQFYHGIGVPLEAIVNPLEQILGYSSSSPFCVDCRFRGTNIRPPFWVDKF